MALIKSPAVTLAIVLSLLFAAAYGGALVGGRTAIKDVKTNKEVQELGRFSVEEYNRSQIRRGRRPGNDAGAGDLRFSQVVEAEKQVVSGIKYYLKVLAVAKTGERRIFDSVVVVKPWLHDSKELLGFTPSTDRDVHF
ncbi:Cystatin [Parasponia andersonii]|uniref:Cystatin n=1 Tax=Parasponia andersonii TaxID=3476 RepID=A0A2P5AA82_PARAD|nr:Cystatin [Parasponia andersonii]